MTAATNIVSSRYFVKATPRRDGSADCQYYVLNDNCYEPATPPLLVPSDAAYCEFVQHPDSGLLLQAAVFKALPIDTKLDYNDYAPFDNSHQAVRVPMPTNATVTKSVVLNFSSLDRTQLYASSDPVIRNGDH